LVIPPPHSHSFPHCLNPSSLDNSEWMRNGDYIPTRLEAQQDAGKSLINSSMNTILNLSFLASLICTARTDSHPENTVGLLTMAGKG
jgi:26S proteasome regulatory subunit N10